MDQILANRQRQNISIQRFIVKLSYSSLTSDYVWINLLITFNVKELFLEVSMYAYIKLPEAIFAAKALNVLRLSGFKLELPSNGIKLSSLRELHLVDPFLDEQFLQALCASCRNLELLSFKRFHGLISFQIVGTLPKLRSVYLEDFPSQFQMVDIVAPSLKDLYISSYGGFPRVGSGEGSMYAGLPLSWEGIEAVSDIRDLSVLITSRAIALNVLRLSGFKLELPSNGIKFSSLRELHLVDLILDEQLLQALCASCRDLEVLSFKRFHGLISFQVVGTLPKLRSVYLEDFPSQFQMVDIVAPNLKDLYISSYRGFLQVGSGDGRMYAGLPLSQESREAVSDRGDLSVLIKITACKTLQCLKLIDVAVTDQWLENLLPNLPNLEIFYLSRCWSLKTVKISSNGLKYLDIVACDNLIEVDLDTPNLLRFSSEVRYGKDIVEPLPTFKLKASHMLEANLNLIPEITLDTNCYNMFMKSLGKFNHSKTITLRCENDKVIVIPKYMRENLIPPLYCTKHLHVIMNRWNHSVVDLVDSLLWISPQLDTLSFGRALNIKTLKRCS